MQISMSVIQRPKGKSEYVTSGGQKKESKDLVCKSLSFLDFQMRGYHGLSVSKRSALPSAAVF